MRNQNYLTCERVTLTYQPGDIVKNICARAYVRLCFNFTFFRIVFFLQYFQMWGGVLVLLKVLILTSGEGHIIGLKININQFWKTWQIFKIFVKFLKITSESFKNQTLVIWKEQDNFYDCFIMRVIINNYTISRIHLIPPSEKGQIVLT